MTLRITLIDEEGNQTSWERVLLDELPGLPADRSSVLWGNIALLAGEVARGEEARATLSREGEVCVDPCRTGVNAA